MSAEMDDGDAISMGGGGKDDVAGSELGVAELDSFTERIFEGQNMQATEENGTYRPDQWSQFESLVSEYGPSHSDTGIHVTPLVQKARGLILPTIRPE